MHTPFFNIHEIQGLIREDKRRRLKEQILDPFSESIETVLQKLTWGLLSNDFIGFHAKEYCDNYLEALEEWFPVQIKVADHSYEIIRQNDVTTLAAFPIGVDVDSILSEVSNGKRLEHSHKEEDLYERISTDKKYGRILFGGLERCDYTKGLLERLDIFTHVFHTFKAEKKDARFYQVTAPSRSDSADYQKLQAALEQEIVKINRTLQEEVVIHIDEGISSPHNYRYMKEVDVMLVTPLEDGMNLVAFEYILSQKFRPPGERGILILSKSGASRVLEQKGFGEQDGLIRIDAMRSKSASEKIVQALRKGRRLSEKIIDYVAKEHRVENWAENNIDAIQNCRKTV
jgi:trehalose-6-phosphate synthase